MAKYIQPFIVHSGNPCSVHCELPRGEDIINVSKMYFLWKTP